MNANVELAAYYLRKGTQSVMSRVLKPAYNRFAPWTQAGRPEPRFDDLERQLLASAEIDVRTFAINVAGFKRWEDEANYPTLAYIANRDEKILEHYVSFVLLELKAPATVVDVASCRSFFPTLLRRRGFRVIAQDLSYPAGLQGDRMGGDAAAIDLPPASIDGVTLHCSFEHFEGDADVRFIANAARFLKPCGRVVILPLYLSQEYCIETDPFVSNGRVPVDSGASLVASFGYGNRHGRHYNLEALLRRVIQPARAANLRPIIYVVENPHAVSTACYLHFALILEKDVCGK